MTVAPRRIPVNEAIALSNRGLSIGEIAHVLGFSAQSVGKKLRKNGVRQRTPNNATLEQQVEWFWGRIKISDPDDCWLWLAGASNDKYGQRYGTASFDGRTTRAHIIAYRLKTGTWPKLLVLHQCGTALCCNPSHLYEGTHKDNTADRIRHGRKTGRSGEGHPQAKLTEAQVAQIRSSREPRKALAERYNVSTSTINAVYCMQNWKSVPGAQYERRGSKLSESDVVEIRASNDSNRVIAERFNVTPQHIWGIRTGKTWNGARRQ